MLDFLTAPRRFEPFKARSRDVSAAFLDMIFKKFFLMAYYLYKTVPPHTELLARMPMPACLHACMQKVQLKASVEFSRLVYQGYWGPAYYWPCILHLTHMSIIFSLNTILAHIWIEQSPTQYLLLARSLASVLVLTQTIDIDAFFSCTDNGQTMSHWIITFITTRGMHAKRIDWEPREAHQNKNCWIHK